MITASVQVISPSETPGVEISGTAQNPHVHFKIHEADHAGRVRRLAWERYMLDNDPPTDLAMAHP